MKSRRLAIQSNRNQPSLFACNRFESSVQSKRLDSKFNESDESDYSKNNDIVRGFDHMTFRNSKTFENWQKLDPADAYNIGHFNMQRKGSNKDQRKPWELMNLNDSI